MLSGLLEQAPHRVTVLALGIQAVTIEDLLKTLLLLLRLLKVMIEGVPQFFVRSVGSHFRKRGDELLLGAIEVAKLVEVELFEIGDHVSALG